MYKKLSLLFAIFFTMFVTSGCVKYSVHLEITPKDELIITKNYGFSTNFFKLFDNPENLSKKLDSINAKEYIKRFTGRGYSVAEYKDENFIGKQFHKKINKAKYVEQNDLPEGFMVPAGAGAPVKISKNAFKTVHAIHLQFDPKVLREKDSSIVAELKKFKADNNNFQNSDELIDKNTETFENLFEQEITHPEFKLTIKIPQKAKEHNATKVDEEKFEYIWILSDMDEVKNGKPVDIILEYQKNNYMSVIAIILFIIFISTIIIINRKYIQKSDETKNAF